MKHYQAPNGGIFAYESDGSQDHLIPADYVAKTDAQIAKIRANEEKAKQPEYMLVAMSNFRKERDRLISRVLDIGLVSREETGNDVVMKKALLIRKGLLDLPAQPAITKAASLDDLEAAIDAAKKGIFAGAPAELIRAFEIVEN